MHSVNPVVQRAMPFKDPFLFWTGAVLTDIPTLSDMDIVVERWEDLQDEDLDTVDKKKFSKSAKPLSGSGFGGASATLASVF